MAQSLAWFEGRDLCAQAMSGDAAADFIVQHPGNSFIRTVSDCDHSIIRSGWFGGSLMHGNFALFYTTEAEIVVRGTHTYPPGHLLAHRETVHFVRRCGVYVMGSRQISDGKGWDVVVPHYRCREFIGRTADEELDVPGLTPFGPM